MAQKNVLLIILLIATGAAGALGDVAIYRWASKEGTRWLPFSFALWVISVVFFGFYLRLSGMAFSFSVVLALIVHIAIVAGYDAFVVKAQLSAMQWAALFIGVASVVMYELGDKGAEP